LRTTIKGSWEEELDGVPHGVLFSLFQVLSEDQALQYQLGNFFQTSHSYQMTDLVFNLRYRQRFYRDWLVFEINPRFSFPEEYDRKISSSRSGEAHVAQSFLSDNRKNWAQVTSALFQGRIRNVVLFHFSPEGCFIYPQMIRRFLSMPIIAMQGGDDGAGFRVG